MRLFGVITIIVEALTLLAPAHGLTNSHRGRDGGVAYTRTFFIAPLTCSPVPIITIVIGGAAGVVDRVRPAGQPGHGCGDGTVDFRFRDGPGDVDDIRTVVIARPARTLLPAPTIRICGGAPSGGADGGGGVGYYGGGGHACGDAYTRTFFIAPLTCLHVPIITIVIGGAAGLADRVRPAGQPGQSRGLDVLRDTDGGGVAYTLTFFIAPLTCKHVPIITIVIGGAAGVVDRVRPAGQPGRALPGRNTAGRGGHGCDGGVSTGT